MMEQFHRSSSSLAKALYDAGVVTSGKSIRYINFGGSVGTKQVWCDFDTQDGSGNSGWMLCAKCSLKQGSGMEEMLIFVPLMLISILVMDMQSLVIWQMQI